MTIVIYPEIQFGYLGGNCTPDTVNWSDAFVVLGFRNVTGTFLGFRDSNNARHTEVRVQCTQNTNESKSFPVNVFVQPDYYGPLLVFAAPGTKGAFQVALRNGSLMTFMNYPQLSSGYLKIGIVSLGRSNQNLTEIERTTSVEGPGTLTLLIIGVISVTLTYGSVRVYRLLSGKNLSHNRGVMIPHVQ